jgi:hypothetical protein
VLDEELVELDIELAGRIVGHVEEACRVAIAFRIATDKAGTERQGG